MLKVSTRRAISARALVDVNKARVSLGGAPLRSLPVATPSATDDCVVQRALRELAPDCEVHREKVVFATHEQATRVCRAWWKGVTDIVLDDCTVTLPASIKDFIGHFDSLGLPEMIDPQTFATTTQPADGDKNVNWMKAREWMISNGLLSADEPITTAVTDAMIQEEILDAEVPELVAV